MDYTIFYREELSCDGGWEEQYNWDIFISAFNSSQRVNKVFDLVNAVNKHWIIQPDYKYQSEEYPCGEVFTSDKHDEAEFFKEYFDEKIFEQFCNSRICIDITGFIKPYMMHLVFLLKKLGVAKVDIIYSEPSYYTKKDKTTFSDENVYSIRQVHGFEGIHVPNMDTSKEILVIGAGYDDELISRIAQHKNNCRKLQIFGLPSLRPEMYQENILNAQKASETIGSEVRATSNSYFAPANDPFVVATELSNIVRKEDENISALNIYLCPLATKPQALGFALYYLTECQEKPVSLIYPYCYTHERETSVGISRISKYTIEF